MAKGKVTLRGRAVEAVRRVYPFGSIEASDRRRLLWAYQAGYRAAQRDLRKKGLSAAKKVAGGAGKKEGM